MKLTFLYPFSIIVATAIIAGCANKNTLPSNNTEEVRNYETITTQLQPVTKTLQLNGELIPYQKASIISKVTGYVKRVAVDIGQSVSAGQTLAVIDAPEMNFQIAEANSKTKIALSKFEATKANYNRLLEASATPGAVAANELDQAKKPNGC